MSYLVEQQDVLNSLEDQAITTPKSSLDQLQWPRISTRNSIVKLLHPQSGYSQVYKTCLARSTAKNLRDNDTKCSKHQCSQSAKDIGTKLCQDKMVSYIYRNLPQKCHGQTYWPCSILGAEITMAINVFSAIYWQKYMYIGL